jgi:hypothetical protein
VNHREFLAESNVDPRRRFAETLIAALKGTKWPIIVSSAYEKTQLTELARIFPDLARPFAAIAKRLPISSSLVGSSSGIFRQLTNAPYKRFVELGEGTHTIMMEKNRMQFFREVMMFLNEANALALSE